MAQVDWRSLVFDGAAGIFPQLEGLARRRFPADATLADEAFNAALDAVSRDDWARLARFDGRGSAQGYLVRVFSHALEDFARQRFGRPRPPALIARRGGVWLRLYQLAIVERRLEPQVLDALSVDTDWPLEDIQAALREVKALCHAQSPPVRHVPLDERLDPENPHEPAAVDARAEPEGQLRRALREQVLAGLARWFGGGSGARGAEAGGAPDPEDQVLLRLLYAEGLSLAASARLLGRPEHEVRRRHQRLLATLRRSLPPADAIAAEDA